MVGHDERLLRRKGRLHDSAAVHGNLPDCDDEQYGHAVGLAGG